MAIQKRLTKNQIRDFKKWGTTGDDGFNPERNKAIIDKTIKKAEANRKAKEKMYREMVAERADAVGSFLHSGKDNLEKYFGKEMLAHLRGEQIVNKLRSRFIYKNRSR